MNSTNESLYYHVPLVMVPQTTEQSGVASRVEQLGCGIRVKDTQISSIMSAIEEIFTNDRYRKNAEDISHGFKMCCGAKGAADKILQVCEYK